MHLNGQIDTQVVDFETIRKRKALKIREAARLRGEEDLDHALGVLPEVKKNSLGSRRNLEPLKVATGNGHIVKLPPEFCETGGDEAPESPMRQNISHTGSWLDRRLFSTRSNDGQGCRESSHHDSKGRTNIDDRRFLKHCKDVVRRRFGNIQIAWKKLNIDGSDSISLAEFVRATSTLFRAHEARFLYGLMDSNGDGSVTFRELVALLDNV